MSRLVSRDVVGLVALVVSVVAVLPLFPDVPWRHLAEPSYQAALALMVTAAVILGQRARGRRGSAFERWWLALFLAGMPLVYLADWAVAGSAHTVGWLGVELAGFVIFASLAVLGVRRSPWFLVAGIVGHGLGWDLWHHGVGFVPDWYATGCLVADLGLGVYAATQVRAWEVGRG